MNDFQLLAGSIFALLPDDSSAMSSPESRTMQSRTGACTQTCLGNGKDGKAFSATQPRHNVHITVMITIKHNRWRMEQLVFKDITN